MIEERAAWPLDELPRDWKWLPFSEVFRNVTDSKRKLPRAKYDDVGAFPVIDQGEALVGGYTSDKGLLNPSSPPFIIFGDHTRCIKFIDFPFVQGADGVQVLKVCELIDARFAFYALKAMRLPNKGYSRHMKLVKASNFPVPPLVQQRRIVDMIELAVSNIGRAKRDIERSIALRARFCEAIIEKAYEESLGAIGGPSKMRKLSTVVTSLDQGWSPRCKKEATSDPRIWAVITTTAIQPLEFNPFQNKALPSTLQPKPSLSIEAGDVLITRAGPRRRVGVTCAVQETKARLMLCDKAYRLKVDGRIALPSYVALMLSAPQSLETIEEMKTGSSDSGLNLTQRKLLDLEIPICRLTDQKAVVDDVSALLTSAKNLSYHCFRTMELLYNLEEEVPRRALAPSGLA